MKLGAHETESHIRNRRQAMFCMKTTAVLLMALLVAVAVADVQAQEYSWQKPHAKVLHNGDLEWAPEPFRFEAGEEVRYIDYENGDDANDGKT
jgi:hypothetical protein